MFFPDPKLAGDVARVIHSIVKRPMSEESEPEFVRDAERFIVCIERSETEGVVRWWGRVQSRYFVVVDATIFIVLVSGYST